MFMETTQITTTKTSSEIVSLLASSGARKIMQEIDDSGEVHSLTFSIVCDGQEVPFKLPIDPEPIWKYLNKKRSVSLRDRRATIDLEQAKRVAWRQVYRWVQAQLALVDTGMVKTQEVFYPYIRMKSGQTLYKQMEAEGLQRALPMLDAE